MHAENIKEKQQLLQVPSAVVKIAVQYRTLC